MKRFQGKQLRMRGGFLIFDYWSLIFLGDGNKQLTYSIEFATFFEDGNFKKRRFDCMKWTNKKTVGSILLGTAIGMFFTAFGMATSFFFASVGFIFMACLIGGIILLSIDEKESSTQEKTG